MADRKISDLTALTTPASGDFLPIVDISEVAAASKNKRITIEELMRGMPNGTAAAPGIAFESDPNTGIYSPGADQLAVATNGTGRLFITSAGSVGIGTTSPNTLLTVGAGNTTPSVAKVIFNTGDVAATPGLVISNWIGSATTNGPRIAFDNSTRGTFEIGGADGTHAFVIVDQQVATERLRIDSSGRLLVGTSSDSGGALLQVNGDRIRVGTAKTPATSGATGAAGEIAWDADYIYVCTATNTWKRTALSTW